MQLIVKAWLATITSSMYNMPSLGKNARMYMGIRLDIKRKEFWVDI